MKIIHYSLVCNSINDADRFYGDCLSLIKTATKTLSSDLSKALFGIEEELVILNYEKNEVFFEIIIYDKETGKPNGINHICVQVDDLDSFLQKIDGYGLKKAQATKGGRTITFVTDFDGNLFEIK